MISQRLSPAFDECKGTPHPHHALFNCLSQLVRDVLMGSVEYGQEKFTPFIHDIISSLAQMVDVNENQENVEASFLITLTSWLKTLCSLSLSKQTTHQILELLCIHLLLYEQKIANEITHNYSHILERFCMGQTNDKAKENNDKIMKTAEQFTKTWRDTSATLTTIFTPLKQGTNTRDVNLPRVIEKRISPYQ